MDKLKTSLKNTDKNTVALLGIAILIFIIMGILAPKSFLSIKNLQGMCVQFPEFGILAFGMMLAMISGGIDLSLVGIANLAGIIASALMIRMGGSNLSIAIGILAAIIVGGLCGVFNGFLIGYLQIPAMLVTLGGLQLYTGLGLAITKGPALTGLPSAFNLIANGTILNIPVALIIFIIAAISIGFLLKSTVYGQHVCFMGTNATAARYSGINNLKVTIYTYGISGILGGVAGILIASHYNSAKSDYGSSYTLLTLLIVVLGGINPDGGRGKVIGVTLAVIVLQLVSSAFNILRVNAFIKTFVWGIILIAVMVGTLLAEKNKFKS
ncbi:ABC transporter permease [Cellulosilyticum sp. I15G10I2]|uniref:ABC transporter permease n=1 Tax=Cellulosilyticum sp. I15G10I2 TaxID=1892843 RepID=UPI00085BF6BC|nr:ABC transporter permease [Cellulosilyticum sp. I15G10I2]